MLQMSTTATATHANMEAHAKRWMVGTAVPALRDTMEITATNTFVEAHISHVCITYRCSVKNFSMLILERSSVGICMLCVGLVMLLWNFMRLLLLCCFPVRVYEDANTCLSIVGLIVVQQVATLESGETFIFSSDFSESYHVPFLVVFFQFFFTLLHLLVF